MAKSKHRPGEGSPNDSWCEPRWSEDQTEPNKEDRARWAEQQAWEPVVNEARGENRRRDWMAQAEREGRCVFCGGPNPERCRADGNCGEQVRENVAR